MVAFYIFVEAIFEFYNDELGELGIENRNVVFICVVNF